jgi:hypothetical protein
MFRANDPDRVPPRNDARRGDRSTIASAVIAHHRRPGSAGPHHFGATPLIDSLDGHVTLPASNDVSAQGWKWIRTISPSVC